MREAQNDAVEGDETVTKTKTSTTMEGVVLFGKYELLRLLGVGAFAKVYQARNVDTRKSVAVKAVSKHKVLKGGFAAHVEREISIMRLLHHPHTIKLFEVLASKTKIYFVMEFAEGGELFHKVAAEGRLTEDLSRRYFQQLIWAVRYCHSHGVFHRDLKLDNLLVDRNMDLKVSDFGLSAVKDQIRPDGLLHTICGTPAYVAPEILTKKGYDGARVDVWSCGVILFALTAGYLPFNDHNITIMYRKIYRGHFRFPKWTSPELRGLLSRLLDTNPKTRITVDEILRDPWLGRGRYSEPRVLHKELEWEENPVVIKSLNAFDLISFSAGFDISGLFSDPEASTTCVERIVSGETPERIIQKVEKVAEMERVTVRRTVNGCGANLEEQDGNFSILVGVYQLTDELVIVEMKKIERRGGRGARFWRDTLRPQLLALAHKQEAPVSR